MTERRIIMWKKALCLVSVLVALWAVVPMVHAESETVFGPSDFEIGSWHIHFSRHTIHVDDPGDGLIVITKNTPDEEINGGFLFFNRRLVPLRTFLAGDDLIVYKDVRLRSTNRLTVFLRGTPQASVSIEIRKVDSPIPSPEVSFSADPLSVLPGDASTLTWETTYADLVSIDNDIGSVSPSGSTEVVPQETTTYVLAAIGPGGTTTASVTVSVSQLPPEVEITADPETIYEGESAVLSWTSSNVDSCVIEPDIGVVDPEGWVTVWPTETTTYAIAATGPGGTATDSVTITVTAPPPTTEISADPESILAGEPTTLSWASTNTTTCVIAPDIGSVDPTGSITISPTETTTYTITATGPGGSATDSVTVTVLYPPTVTVSADPEAILFGGSSTLSWSSTHTDTCEIQPDIGPVDPSGSISVSPTETTLYTITATGPGGTATDSVTVTVTYPAPTVSISADPQTILLGESATLSWSSTYADSATIDQSIGSVPVNGSTMVSPGQTTTYTITATGLGGTATDSVTVTVLYPPTATISADPETILLGASATLTWSSTHTVSCVIEPGVGTVDPSGSIPVSPTVTTTYTITATGPGGTATDTVTVTVLYLPTVTISADPESIIIGGSSTLTWSSTYADTCEIQPDVGTVDPTGSTTVSPTETTTYTITATGPGGTATDTVTVTVLYLPTVTISADPESIIIGESSTLTWTSTNADTCEIQPDVGTVDPTGATTVSPTETTTYTITATGPGGSATDTVTVTVSETFPEPTVSLSADPSSIEQGESTTLSWTSTYGQSAYIDNGIGVVSVSGSTSISPDHTTTYAISVTGTGGSASARAVVMVTGNPEPQPEGWFGEQYEDLTPFDATAESYDPRRFSLITGLVQDLADAPIADVSVTILNHPEYGTVETGADGRFSIPVEGGGTMTVMYEKDGLLRVQRKVHVPWNDIAIAKTIVMIAEDTASTTVTFDGNPETVVTHQSTEVTDAFGSRSCSMVFTGDNGAYLVDDEGNDIHELTTITTRATEFTTPESMPAILPPNSGYTYCAELNVDGAPRVRFDKPVITWVDNFLGFNVGEIVPVGYYDRDKGMWVASDNGVVVRLLDTDTDGVVDALDADGDGQPDDLNENASYSDEVAGLDDAGRYPPDSTFWRVEVTHFTIWDFNWPFGPPGDATPPNADTEAQVDQQQEKCKTCPIIPPPPSEVSSTVEQRSRVFHEDIPIPGTDMTLYYASNRVKGYHYRITVPASGETVPASLKHIVARVDVSGRIFEQILAAEPNQNAEFVWDGLDHLGRLTVTIPAHVSVGFVYDAVYYSGREAYDQAFAKAGDNITGIIGREEMTSWRHSDVMLVKGRGTVAEGWTISPHHQLSPIDPSVLHKGNASIAKNQPLIIDTVAGKLAGGIYVEGGLATEAGFGEPKGVAVDASGNLYIADYYAFCIRKVDTNGIITTAAGNGGLGYPVDGVPATETALGKLEAVAVDASGNLYIADSYFSCVRKVDTNGIITTVAGNTTPGYSGDGGPATQAQLYRPHGMAVDASGNLFIADSGNHCVRQVDTNGIITTVAGTGTAGFIGDGGFANYAWLNAPRGVAVDASGNLFIADTGNSCIRQVDTTGIITTVAGTGSLLPGDGGPATEAQLQKPWGVAVDASGNLFIGELNAYRVRKVYPSGIITTAAGNGTMGDTGDGNPATQARLYAPMGVAVSPSGDLYIADSNNGFGSRANGEHGVIRKVAPPFRIAYAPIAGDILFAEEDGLCHVIDSTGQHTMTVDLDTGVSLYEFGYNENSELVSIADRFGNETTIARDANGVPSAIISPDGLTTTLTLNGSNRLTGITYPDNSSYGFEYTTGDLMTAKVEPEGNRFEHVFDATGRLTDATDEEGGHWQLSKSTLANGDILTQVLTGEGNLTSFLDHTDTTGQYTSTITGPTGAETLFSQSEDGLTVNKSLPCGMELAFRYGLDPQYQFQFVRRMSEMTPSALERLTLRQKSYQDTNADTIPDLITETVWTNGMPATLQTDTLQATKVVTSPEARTVTTHYNPVTLLTAGLEIPGLHDTAYGYDARGRLTSITTNTRETTFAYDAQGFLASITDPEDHTTSYTYDAAGRMTGIDRPDSTSVGFTYDDNGNMTVLTNPSTVDHGFGYNKVNLNNSYQTPLSGSYTYVYDKDRRLVQTNFPSGNQINNIYDTTRLIQIQTPEGNVDLTYLCATNVGSISKGTESITYGYDGSLVTSETLGGTVNQSLGYTYNNDFNLAGFTYAGNSHVYTYDDDGLLTGAGGFAIARNSGNGLPEAVTGGSLSLSRNFNGYGEVEAQDFTINSSSLTDWSLTRDDNGRITGKNETVDGVTSNYVYTYDPMGRLLTVTKDGSLVEEYQYGFNGTRTYEMNTLRGISGRTFNYSAEDHLLTVDSTTYDYDVDGFLTTRTAGSDVTTYDYSSRGELLSVGLPDGTTINYVHDPLGRRIAKKVDGITTEKYVWQGLTRLLAVYDGGDNLEMRFEYADGRMPVAMTKDGSTYYLTCDQVGSLRLVADVSGNVPKKIDYDSFGNVINDTDPTVEVPFGFAGGLHDRDTGLVRFGFRDYDPDVARWTAKDPVLFAGSDTDLYGYCLNDSINRTDTSGSQLQLFWNQILEALAQELFTQQSMEHLRQEIEQAKETQYAREIRNTIDRNRSAFQTRYEQCLERCRGEYASANPCPYSQNRCGYCYDEFIQSLEQYVWPLKDHLRVIALP